MRTSSAEYPDIFKTLSHDKKTKVDTLKEILKNYTTEQCLHLLEANLWDVEASVESLNGSRSDAEVLSSHDSMTGTINREMRQGKRVLPRYISNEILLPVHRERIFYSPVVSKDLHPWLYNFIKWTSEPLNMTLSTFNLILQYLLFWKRNEQTEELLDMYESELMQILTSHLFIPNNETGSVSFFLGTFEEAVAQAKHEYKLLLVYLHRLGNTEADNFLYFSFLNGNVVNLLNDPEHMLIWAGHLSSDEGKEVSYLFKIPESCSTNVTEYLYNPLLRLFEYPEPPFLFSLLTITTLNGGNKMTVIGQLEKSITAVELSKLLNKWIQVGSRPMLIAKREKATREADTDLKKIQEIAFNNMLEKDRIKEALIQSEIDRTITTINTKKELRIKLKEMENDLKNMFSDPSSILSLLIKMQNGRRFDWKFLSSSSTKYLFYLVYSQEDAPADFELLWNYPQRILNCKAGLPNSSNLNLQPHKDDPQTFEQLGLLKNEIILVRDLDV